MSKVVDVTFKVGAIISDAQSSISTLKNSLKDLTLPESQFKTTDKILKSLYEDMDELRRISKGDVLNTSNMNKADKLYERISSSIEKLNEQTEKIEGLDPKKILPEEINNRIKEFEKSFSTLQKNIQEGFNTQEIKAASKELEKAQNQLSKYNELLSESNSYRSLAGAQTKKINRATAEREGLAEDSDRYKELTKTINEATEARNRYLAAAQAKRNQIEKEFPAEKVKEYNTSIEFLTNRLKQLNDAEKKTTFKNLSRELEQFKGLKEGSLNITSLEQLKRIIETLPIDKVQQLGLMQPFDEWKKGVTALNPQVEKLEGNLEDAKREGTELTERAKDLEHVANQVKQFFSIGNTIQLFKRSIRSAFETIKELDEVMTQTAVVTDFSVGDMWAQLPEYTKRANELGVSVKGAYEAATLYYQQGLDTNQVIGVSNETLKMAKIAAIDYATATDYMTSALRGFNMEVNEDSARRVNDIYSELAARTAADTEEISVAMSKTAPLAHNAGMEIETTAAFLAQAIETTREAPETIGTALKTVIARFQELKKDPALIEPVDGEIVDANKIEGALRSIGVALRDTSGQFRDLDDVFLEISQKWNSLDTNTQRYIATIAAGSRQQSRFIAMMANYDRTMELVEMANDSAGASQQQFEKTLDSMQSKLDRLKNAWNEFTMGLANNSIIKGVIDLLTGLLNTINKISSSVSGNNGILKSLIDIGVLAGGLKTARGLFNGFFGWLNKDAENNGGKIWGNFIKIFAKKSKKDTGKNFLNELFGSLTNWNYRGSKFGKGIVDLEADLTRVSNGTWTKKDLFANWNKWNYKSTKLSKGLVSLQADLSRLSSGMWTKKDLFENWKSSSPTVKKISNTFNNIKDAGRDIIGLFKAIPPQAYAIALGIGAITTATILLIKATKENSLKERIKEAEENTKLAEEAAAKAKETYDNLLSGKSTYDELQNKLNDLTYGTQEWKQALIEANGQVLELLQTFPQLAQYMTPGANGRLEISAEGWDTILSQQEDVIRRNTNNILGSQIYRANLENEKYYKDLQKSSGIKRRGLLDELIKLYENDSSAFVKDKNGNYSQQLQDLSHIWGINVDKLYEAQNALQNYEAAVQQNGQLISSYVDSLIANNNELEGLTPEIANFIQEAFNSALGGRYNEKINQETNKLLGTGQGREGPTTSLNYINSILKEYGLETEGSIKTGLQSLYKYLADITGEEIDSGILDNKEAMASAIAKMRFGDELKEGIDNIAVLLENDGTGGIQKILNVLNGNFQKFSSIELENFGDLTNANLKDFAKSMGLSEEQFKTVFESLGYTFDEFRAEFGQSIEEMAEQIKQSKIDLVQAMLDSGSFTDSRAVNARLSGLSDQQITSLSGISSQISVLNKETQSSLLKNLPYLYKQGHQQEIEDLFDGLDFSDPINGLNQLQEAAEKGSNTVKTIAQTIIDMEPELFSAGNLFNNFMKSADFEQVDEQLKDFIKTNGKITPQNINELAKSSDKLNKLLKTGTVTAGALAKAFTAINVNNIPMESFTNKVLEALSVTETFDEKLSKAQDYWDNLNPGIDEGEFLDDVSKITDAIEKITEKGQYGNTALEGYLASVYGAENLNLSTDYDTRKNQVDSIVNQLNQWEAGDGLGFITDAYERFGEELGFVIEDGKAILDVGTRTTEELVNDIAKAMGVTEEYASSQLALYSAHTPALRAALAQNDFQAQIAELTKVDGNQLAVLNESELQAFAVATGQELEDVKQYVQEHGIKIVDFIDEDTGVGAVGDKLVGMIENQLKGEHLEFDFLRDLNLADAWSIEDGNVLIDIDKIKQKLEELGLTAEQINSIFESDSFNSWLQNAASSVNEELDNGITEIENGLLSKTIEIPVKVTDEHGNEHIELQEITVASDSMEGLTAAENAAIEAANYELVASSIVDQDFSGLSDNITTIVGNAADQAAEDLRTKINGVKFSNKKIGVSVTYSEKNKPAILTVMGYASGTTLNLDNVWNAVNKKTNPSVNNTTKKGRTYHPSGSGGRYVESAASGTNFGGLKHNEIALTGEEGYELAYDSHGAFLLGKNGPEITKLEKGTVIYPHDLSKKILKGHSTSIFPNYKTGTISNYVAPDAGGGITVIGGYTTEQWSEVNTNLGGAASSASSFASSMEKAADAAEDAADETEEIKKDIDWLYNKTQEINNLLRQREKLERQYQRLLKTHTATGEELRRITDEEIAKLQKRQEEEKKMIELRKKELHTYMMLNKEMMKYAIIDNWDDMTIHIAYDTINSLTDQDELNKAMDFIHYLEDMQGKIYDLEDDIEDIEDDLIDIKNRGEDEYRDLEDRVLDALIKEQEDMIDEQEKTNKSITDAKNDLIDSIQKNIDKMRQDRQNEETETSLAEKERRLAYLRQDTTGSNALEIKKLEKELRDERQDYTDTLIDQALKDMKEQADEAAKQRDEQIELMRSQLEWQEKTGYFADEATRIVQEGLAADDVRGTRLYNLLYEGEGVAAFSNASKTWWENTLKDTVAQAQNWLLGQNAATEGEGGNGSTDYMAKMIEALDSGDFSTFASLEQERNKKIQDQGLQSEWPETTMYSSYQQGKSAKIDPNTDYMAKVNEAASNNQWKDVFYYAGMRDAKIASMGGTDYKADESFSIAFKKWYNTTGGKKFATGGLADFTGPAWLDGSKSKPEMVLNPKDTENFIQLKNLLAGNNIGNGGNGLGGDWYFNIDINVDKIANDYDVDRMAEKIKKSIYNEATYRNVNAINFLK